MVVVLGGEVRGAVLVHGLGVHVRARVDERLDNRLVALLRGAVQGRVPAALVALQVRRDPARKQSLDPDQQKKQRTAQNKDEGNDK